MKWDKFVETGGKNYSDWFGNGNTLADARKITDKKKVHPFQVFEEYEGYMICLVFEDEIVMTGYDGNEYCHTITFTRTDKDNPSKR